MKPAPGRFCQMNSQNTELFIATPCAGGLLHQGYVTSVLSLGAAQFHINVQFYGGDSLIRRARNILVSKFLESHEANMLFIDADIYFDLEQILAMLNWSRSNPGIIAGRYRAKHKAIDYVGVLENEYSNERFSPCGSCLSLDRHYKG
jgi:hypothetical protein